MSIHVLKQGLQTTVQDLGRPGFAHLGISASGAADAFSIQIGNLLVGNEPNTAALEITITGGKYKFTTDSYIALSGSDFDAQIDGKTVANWTSVSIKKGQCLQVNKSLGGARCYLSVQGGIDVPILLNSRSTHLMTGLGGFDGCVLKKDYVLKIGHVVNKLTKITLINKQEMEQKLERKTIRVTKGLEGDWFNDDTWELFLNKNFRVSQSFSRMGIRLEGNTIQSTEGNEIMTQGISLGVVQIPGNGEPIISFVEHQTTGGYPRIANIISADFCKVGQLKPGDKFKFALVTIDQAEQLYKMQLKIIHNIAVS